MKKAILISILSVFIVSCSNLNYGNFNKQKFTKLKTRSVKTVQNQKADKPIKVQKIDKVSFAKSTNVKKEQLIVKNNIVNNSIKNKLNLEQSTAKNTVTAETVSDEIEVKSENFKADKNFRNISNRVLSHLKINKINGLVFFLILLGFPLFFIRDIGLKMANWAKHNVKKAQILIGVFTITGLLSSFLLGNLFDFNISKLMFIAPVTLGLGSLFINKVKTKRHFFKNKLSISMLSTSSLFMSFSAGSHTNFHLMNVSREMTIHPVLAVLLSLIIVAVLAVSIYGLAILACEISCAGYGVLAVIVFFGGSTGLIYLATVGIYRLFRKKGKSKDKAKHKEKNKEKKEVNKNILWGIILLLAGTIIGLVL